MAAKEYSKFARGVEVAVEGKYVFLKIDTDKAKGEPSSTGKMKLTASTAGFKSLDEVDGYSIMLNAGYKVKGA